MRNIDNGFNKPALARSYSHSGPSRVIYNATGTEPNWDNTPYNIYLGVVKWQHNKDIEWEIRFPGYETAYTSE
jgi:hypothetical protein